MNGHIVVVYGPAGSGKTRHAEALARHYRCATIADEGRDSHTEAALRMAAHRGGVLVLEQRSSPGAIHIEDALRAAGIGART